MADQIPPTSQDTPQQPPAARWPEPAPAAPPAAGTNLEAAAHKAAQSQDPRDLASYLQLRRKKA